MDKKLHAIKVMLAVLAGCWLASGCTHASAQGKSAKGRPRAAWQSAPEDKQVYLFSSFRGEREGLYLAYSEDLFNWTEIPGPHMKPTIGDKVMRDPFIMMGADGTIHMVWTTGWGRRDIGYANTRDLINWSEPRLLPLMQSKPRTKNCWAPKIFYDGQKKQWQIVWSSWVDDGTFPPPELPHTSKQHRIWYVTTKDFETFTEPKVLLDPGYSCIDAYLIEADGEYLLFFKDERYNDSQVVTPAHQNIRMARSRSRYGPFGDISEPITGQGPGKWHNEGACAVKHQGEYYVFYDHHSGQTYFGATKSRDLKHWTDVSNRMNFPKGLKHGSIIKVPRSIVDTLFAFVSDPNAHYSQMLKVAVYKSTVGYLAGPKLLSTYRGNATPIFVPQVEGLNDVNAVPFLLQVIYEGPDWPQGDRFSNPPGRHIAKCYAVLSLAATGDPTAFGVLTDLLQSNPDSINADATEDLIRRHDIRMYAAVGLGMLADPNATDVLLRKLHDTNPYVRRQCFWSLAKIGELRAIEPMLEAAVADEAIDGLTLHTCMEKMTKVKLHIETVKPPRNRVTEFPELGTAKLGTDFYIKVWQHWFDVRRSWTEGEFKDKYHTLSKSKRKYNYQAIARLGIPALPLLIEKIEQGETDLIPLVSQLVDKELPEDATQQQCLEWWDNNKDKWTIAFAPQS